MEQPTAKPSECDSWCAHLNANGYRVTGSGRIIIETFLQIQGAVRAEALYEQVRLVNPRVGRSTVYRTLEKLDHTHLIQRIHDGEGCHAYVRDSASRSGLLMCQHCGRVEYLDGNILMEAVNQFSQQSGYRIQTYLIQLFGLCGDCKTSIGRA